MRSVLSLLWVLALLGAVATCTDADPGDGDSADDSGDAADGDDSSGDGAVPSCDAVDGPYEGEATYYAANGSGNCSFDRSSDLMVAALNDEQYAGAGFCGGCVEVSGPDGSVVVRIVDKCPGCVSGDLDLSEEAFAMIAPLSAGRVDISWTPVACDVEGSLEYQFKDGSSQYWTAIQVRNHRYPITKLEVQTGPDAWQELERLEYNYFVETDGLGVGPYTLRVTDTRGHVVIDEGIELGDDVSREGTQQFPVCTGD